MGNKKYAAVIHSLPVMQGKHMCLRRNLSDYLSVWLSISLYLFCILCRHKSYMYICICLLSIVGTSVLNRCTDICSIIVLYLL